MDIKKIEKLAQLLKEFQLQELEIVEGGDKIRLAQGGVPFTAGPAHHHPHHLAMTTPAPTPVSHSAPAPSKGPEIAAESPNQKTIRSPFVGTYYAASSPDAEPFVRAGQAVKRGDVLCIIEAMKLMNEIEADVAGTILKVLIENGQPVEFDQPLFVLQ